MHQVLIKSLAVLLLGMTATTSFAHDGVGTFTVLSMTPGYWICNAKVTNQTSDPINLPGDVTSPTLVNSLKSNINGPWYSGLQTDATGSFLNLNQSSQSHIHNVFDSLVFTLKSSHYNATYTVDLCTTDPGGDAGDMSGPVIANFKTWVSVRNLNGNDDSAIDGTSQYLERSQVHYSSSVSCGRSQIYSPSIFQFADNSTSKVGPLAIVNDLDLSLQSASWNGNMVPTTVKAPYCVTRFVFNETSNGRRSNVLEGGLFTIAVSQMGSNSGNNGSGGNDHDNDDDDHDNDENHDDN